MVVCGQTLRQVVAQLELELLRPCQLMAKNVNCLVLDSSGRRGGSRGNRGGSRAGSGGGGGGGGGSLPTWAIALIVSSCVGLIAAFISCIVCCLCCHSSQTQEDQQN